MIYNFETAHLNKEIHSKTAMVHISFSVLKYTENSLQKRLFKSNFEINLLHSVRTSLNDSFRTFFLFFCEG